MIRLDGTLNSLSNLLHNKIENEKGIDIKNGTIHIIDADNGETYTLAATAEGSASQKIFYLSSIDESYDLSSTIFDFLNLVDYYTSFWVDTNGVKINPSEVSVKIDGKDWIGYSFFNTDDDKKFLVLYKGENKK